MMQAVGGNFSTSSSSALTSSSSTEESSFLPDPHEGDDSYELSSGASRNSSSSHSESGRYVDTPFGRLQSGEYSSESKGNAESSREGSGSAHSGAITSEHSDERSSNTSTKTSGSYTPLWSTSTGEHTADRTRHAYNIQQVGQYASGFIRDEWLSTEDGKTEYGGELYEWSEDPNSSKYPEKYTDLGNGTAAGQGNSSTAGGGRKAGSETVDVKGHITPASDDSWLWAGTKAFFGSLVKDSTEVAVGEIPFVGDAAAAKEAIDGTNIYGEEVGTFNRVTAAISVAVPGAKVGGKAIDGLGAIARGIGSLGRGAADLLNFAGRKADNVPGAVPGGGKQSAPLGGKKPTPDVDTPQGTIYRVPGEHTPSGKPYIGRHNQADPSKTRRSSDGRDRSQAVVIDTYDASDELSGRIKEERHILNEGLDNLDNKRHEIAPRKFPPER